MLVLILLAGKSDVWDRYFTNPWVNPDFQLNKKFYFNSQTPVARKIADEVDFRRFQGEGVDFLKSDHTDPPQIFDAHL